MILPRFNYIVERGALRGVRSFLAENLKAGKNLHLE